MDYAIIGDYASEKMLVTEFNIDRSRESSIQVGRKRKVVAGAKQSVSISLSGYLKCGSFEELEEEIERLQYELNKPEIKLSIGAKPTVYYLVSWNGTGLDRKANNGGYVLPFTLDFQGLEETAVKGVVASLAWIKEPISGYYITQSGKLLKEDDVVYESKSYFASVDLSDTSNTDTFIIFEASGHLITVKYLSDRCQINYKYQSNFAPSIDVPLDINPTVGIVFYEDRLSVYYNGTEIVLDSKFTDDFAFTTTDLFAGRWEKVKWAIVSRAAYPAAYVADGIQNLQAKSIGEVGFLPTGSTDFINAGKAQADASIIFKIGDGQSSFLVNSSGASFSGVYGDYIYFSGIDADIYSNNQNVIETTTYYQSSKTLLPSLARGGNTITKSGNSNAVIIWQERYY